MLLRIKIYLVSILYTFGTIFMFFFPPRNFSLAGAKVREKRDLKDDTNDTYYISYTKLESIAEEMTKHDGEVLKMIRLSPPTAENRSVIALELKSDKQSKKPGILIIGALNGMAWGAPNAIIELTQRLLYDSNYQSPFFNDYNWFMIPMANPDGLEFTKQLSHLAPVDDMMWSRNFTARNNTRPVQWHKNVDDTEPKNIHCFGTNINRNFAYHWQDDVHKMPDRCSQYYPGLKPFSSAETQAIRDYLGKIADDIDLAIHLHASFVPKKEYILFPWRYSLRLPSNFRTLQDIGEYAARHSRLPEGRYYEVHQSSNDNRVAGSITDYLSGVVGSPLVYLIKPYFPKFPNISDPRPLDSYTTKAVSAMLSLVRGWRKSTKLNTLYFFGKEVEF